jgi:hypothetical protein
MSIIAIAITILAIILFGAFLLLGTWIDGRRQALRNKGLHPTTTSEGQVEARESEHGTSSQDD